MCQLSAVDTCVIHQLSWGSDPCDQTLCPYPWFGAHVLYPCSWDAVSSVTWYWLPNAGRSCDSHWDLIACIIGYLNSDLTQPVTEEATRYPWSEFITTPSRFAPKRNQSGIRTCRRWVTVCNWQRIPSQITQRRSPKYREITNRCHTNRHTVHLQTSHEIATQIQMARGHKGQI